MSFINLWKAFQIPHTWEYDSVRALKACPSIIVKWNWWCVFKVSVLVGKIFDISSLQLPTSDLIKSADSLEQSILKSLQNRGEESCGFSQIVTDPFCTCNGTMQTENKYSSLTLLLFYRISHLVDRSSGRYWHRCPTYKKRWDSAHSVQQNYDAHNDMIHHMLKGTWAE